MLLRLLLAAAVIGLGGCAPSLAAAPHLVARWPLDGAELSVSSHVLELTFNTVLDPIATWASVQTLDGGVTLRTRATPDLSDARKLEIRIFDPLQGSYTLHWHAVAAEAGGATDGQQRLEFQGDPPSPPRVDVSPSTAESGERLELVGKGFARESPVTLTIGDGAQTLATTRTDAAGKFNLEARVPVSVPLGVQPVAATDAERHLAVGSVEVRWGGWPPVMASDVGEAGPEPDQVTFTVTPRNLSDYVLEHVRVVVKDPEGGVFVDADPGAQRQDDTLEWLIPVMDRGAYGPFRATYRASQPLVSHAWIEFRHRRERGCSGGGCLPAFISSSMAISGVVATRDP